MTPGLFARITPSATPAQAVVSLDVKRDVYFGELAYVRQTAVRNAAVSVIFMALLVAVAYGEEAAGRPIWGVIGLLSVVKPLLSIGDWRKKRSEADGDPDLMYDGRLATEDKRVPFMNRLSVVVTLCNAVTMTLLIHFLLDGSRHRF